MNGKKAKMLRRLAEESTIGIPSTEYEKRKWHAKGHWPPIVLIESCTRRLYKKLKSVYLGANR